MWLTQPLKDLAGYSRAAARKDLFAAFTTLVMAIPQGVAYAMIAGLPPAMGLYASMLPAIIGALFRSSRHVITGPTNALSLLVGAALANLIGVDPVQAAITLAFMVGVLQISAGLLRLGALVDYVSSAVVLGYITGAGILIGVGQLPHLTGTVGERGHVFHQLMVWSRHLSDTDFVALALGLTTASVILLFRRFFPRLPAPILAILAATGLSSVLHLPDRGLKIISDLSPIPSAWPNLTLPEPSLVAVLMPAALAATVLSLVESSAIARALASQTRQRLEMSNEFFGQGLANVVAGLFSGYPISGSLGRSVLNLHAGAQSRLSGVYGGVMMVGVLLVLGPLVNLVPVAALAGLLMVVAVDLIDHSRIRFLFRASWPDRLTFLATFGATWIFPLDQALYLGVGINLILFLRQARILTARQLVVAEDGRLQEVADLPRETSAVHECPSIRILQLEGRLFFGVEGELRDALMDLVRESSVQTLLVRLKRTQGIDVTIAWVFKETAEILAEQGRHLILVGIREETLALLEQTGVAKAMGEQNLYPTRPRWFEAMDQGIEHALALCQAHDCETCPYRHYLNRR